MYTQGPCPRMVNVTQFCKSSISSTGFFFHRRGVCLNSWRKAWGGLGEALINDPSHYNSTALAALCSHDVQGSSHTWNQCYFTKGLIHVTQDIQIWHWSHEIRQVGCPCSSWSFIANPKSNSPQTQSILPGKKLETWLQCATECSPSTPQDTL